MICKYCHREIKDGSEKCPRCWASLVETPSDKAQKPKEKKEEK